ncbi:MAG: iron-only hydrogenase system regulator [Clostridium sp.]|nr:iron-only hydrogenase system regulator [Clostridium sp.]MCM1547144.1 iron-only hydrogenase system regulator [Ruminococcus sp.]
MENRIAVLGIIVDDLDMSHNVNAILHEYGDVIIGRMGIPYKNKNVSVISVVIDADTDKISALTGKLGKLNGVNVKAAISKK